MSPAPRPAPGPEHYERLEPQPIEVIEAWDLGFHAGNVLKYLARAGHKPEALPSRDWRKAAWYCMRAAQLAELSERRHSTMPAPSREDGVELANGSRMFDATPEGMVQAVASILPSAPPPEAADTEPGEHE
jgi:hypothetical protein